MWPRKSFLFRMTILLNESSWTKSEDRSCRKKKKTIAHNWFTLSICTQSSRPFLSSVFQLLCLVLLFILSPLVSQCMPDAFPPPKGNTDQNTFCKGFKFISTLNLTCFQPGVKEFVHRETTHWCQHLSVKMCACSSEHSWHRCRTAMIYDGISFNYCALYYVADTQQMNQGIQYVLLIRPNFLTNDQCRSFATAPEQGITPRGN